MARKELLKNLFHGFLLLSISLIVYFCADDNNLATLMNSFHSMNLFWLFSSFSAIAFVCTFDSAFVYNISRSTTTLSRRECFKCTMVGQFFSSVSQYMVAGQPIQILYLTSCDISTANALLIVVRKFWAYQTTIASYSLLVTIIRLQHFKAQVIGFMYLTIVGFFRSYPSHFRYSFSQNVDPL